MDEQLKTSIQNLRTGCNRIIRYINQGRGIDTHGFEELNGLLKLCDKVFEASDQNTID